MTYPKTDNCCTNMGWVEYLVYNMGGEMHVSVEPDTDLDGRVVAFCHDEQEMIIITGHLCEFVLVTEETINAMS